ncbi:hypothetical protein LTR05_006630 [Lithohypha guttulata]|uniref:Uncharacterized protein n=1 Tax=Lithohypha guttulata TaxID=1690604 RepID=A0AAN7YE15_9EURO|nr:hypothetical protein LTR05_006630 [Lithohypha guttulata]
MSRTLYEYMSDRFWWAIQDACTEADLKEEHINELLTAYEGQPLEAAQAIIDSGRLNAEEIDSLARPVLECLQRATRTPVANQAAAEIEGGIYLMELETLCVTLFASLEEREISWVCWILLHFGIPLAIQTFEEVEDARATMKLVRWLNSL